MFPMTSHVECVAVLEPTVALRPAGFPANQILGGCADVFPQAHRVPLTCGFRWQRVGCRACPAHLAGQCEAILPFGRR